VPEQNKTFSESLETISAWITSCRSSASQIKLSAQWFWSIFPLGLLAGMTSAQENQLERRPQGRKRSESDMLLWSAETKVERFCQNLIRAESDKQWVKEIVFSFEHRIQYQRAGL